MTVYHSHKCSLHQLLTVKMCNESFSNKYILFSLAICCDRTGTNNTLQTLLLYKNNTLCYVLCHITPHSSQYGLQGVITYSGAGVEHRNTQDYTLDGISDYTSVPVIESWKETEKEGESRL